MKIKVLYISHEYNCVNGTTRSLCNMINSIRDYVEPIVIIPHKGATYDYIVDKEIKCYTIPFTICSRSGNFKDKTFCIKYIPRLLKYIILNCYAILRIVYLFRKDNISIVHTNTSVIDFGGCIAKLLKSKHIWHLREYGNKDHGLNPLLGWNYLRNKINNADITISITNSVKEHFGLIGKKNAYTLFNAVQKSCDLNLEYEKENYFLFCGTISYLKGVETAINVFIKLNKKYPNFKLRIVGAGNTKYIKSLKNMLDEIHEGKNIIFEGYQNNPIPIMRKSRALLMCSKNEAMGRVTAEAMLNGCPVIGYKSGGTIELIKNKETGFLYTNDEELYNFMEYVIKSNIKILIDNAYSYAKDNFLEESYRRKIISIYKSCIK